MNDILRDFDKKNEFSKVSIDRMKIGGKELSEEVANNILNGNFDLGIEKIAKDIAERQDNAMAIEFTKCIGELLKKNGVVPKITEYTRNFETDNTFETIYGVSIDELDFSKHDKVFEDKIAKLQIKNEHIVDEKNKLREIINKKLGGWDDYGVSFEEIFGMRDENKELKQRIAELEDKIGDRDEINRCLREQIEELQKENENFTEEYKVMSDFANKQMQKCEKLESREKQNTVEVRLPASPIEIATYLINNTCTINELKMIAEHINVYCNGGK